MHRRQKYGRSTKPTFRDHWWSILRFIQWVFMWVCLVYILLAGSTELRPAKYIGHGEWIRDTSEDEVSIMFTKYGWSYLLCITTISLVGLILTFSMVAECFRFAFTPAEAFHSDLILIVLLIITLASLFVGLGATKNVYKLEEYIFFTDKFPETTHWVAVGFIILLLVVSLINTRLTFLEHKGFPERPAREIKTWFGSVRERAKQKRASWGRSEKRTSSVSPLPVTASSTPPTLLHASGQPDQITPPEPARTREQVIRDRIEAVAAPPSYFYATSQRAKDDADVLPRYAV